MKDWKKSDLEISMNEKGWKLYSNERLSQSSLGSPLELHCDGRLVDFAKYKDISKQDVVEHYSNLKREYKIVDKAFDNQGHRLENTVAVYVKF